MLSIIFATSWPYLGIGINNHLPWENIEEDMRHFKKITTANHSAVIMGAKTWQSLPIKPLPARINVVISSRSNARSHYNLPSDVIVYNSLRHALSHLHIDCFVIGGLSLIEEARPLADHIYMTKIFADLKCDIYLSNIWKTLEFSSKYIYHETARIMDKKSNIEYSFAKFIRKK